MNSSNVGRNVAIAVILAILTWSGARALGARPPAIPRLPIPKPAIDAPLATSSNTKTAILAGGCFWGVQAVFEHLKGVISVTSGYSGGFLNSPSYTAVSTGATGHAESVRVTYDPSQLSYGQILMVFFSIAHDPTQLNRQGPDTGSQYRSAIFYADEEQKTIAAAYIKQFDEAKVYDRPMVTQLVPFKAFYDAEKYHQDYLKRNPTSPYIVYNDLPKLENVKKLFPDLYRDY